MEYETEEQQVEALKEWWAENGKAVIAGVVLGVGAIGGWTFWKGHQEKQAVVASDTFSRTIEALNGSDTAAALSLADELKDDQPDALYSAYANMAAARASVEGGDLADAASRLEWVADNAPQDDVRLIARVRLARVLGANGDAAAGLDSLPADFPEAFAGLVEEARGDLLLINGDADGARQAYLAAQDSQFVANREGLTMKLNELTVSDGTEDGSESAS
ncbi:YfgM family protein [Granulosicoccus sp. 3-233]|uniref:YfgM family protein n=1 Tax=Granulosicoccus sp. 3-233 TaxID=3417969 RepID=UPI003D32524A